jgi:glutathione synthase/RimK-type ligase-like ATP-grasp enzyme
MRIIEAIILSNEFSEDHLQWINACENCKGQLNYRIVNLSQNNWLEEIRKHPFDILLAKPGGVTSSFKQLYDERIYILERVLGYKIFPSAEEIFIYENKRFLSYWLEANKIPHPHTSVFYNIQEAKEYLETKQLPVVAKTNIGASGSGVRILLSHHEALNYLNQVFSGKGAPKRYGPNPVKGGLLNRALHYLYNPSEIPKKLRLYNTRRSDAQYGFVIFQEYIPHDYEWRVVRIGDSYFAHKKLKVGSKASGSLLKSYENPPMELLNFVKAITDIHHFYSQAIDIFESERGYLVNEMQCIFGQSDPYQMLVNRKPGRYLYEKNTWLFEEGDWATNSCYNLRLDYLIRKISSTQGTSTLKINN